MKITKRIFIPASELNFQPFQFMLQNKHRTTNHDIFLRIVNKLHTRSILKPHIKESKSANLM